MSAARSAAAYLRQRVQARIAIARLLPLAGAPLAVSAVVGYLLVGLAPIGFVVATSVLTGRLPAAAGRGWHSPAGRAAASSSSPTVAALEDPELLRLLAEAGGELEYNPNTPGRAVAGLLALIARYTPPAAAAILIGAVFS